MPDWSYRTLFRPVLFALPPKLARDFTVGVMGTLARTPLGPHVIDFMGHMRPSPRLAREVLGRTFAGPIGIAAELDPSGYALPALARFGVGFVVLGPCGMAKPAAGSLRRHDALQAIEVPAGYTSIPIERALSRLAALPKGVPAIVRVGRDEDGEVIGGVIAQAAERQLTLAAVAVEAQPDPLSSHAAIAGAGDNVPLLLTLPTDFDPHRAVQNLFASLASEGPAGVEE
jgi:hypothetical protein